MIPLDLILKPEHSSAGLYVEEDDHVVTLKRGGETRAIFSSTGTTVEVVQQEADRIVSTLCHQVYK